MGWNLGRRMSGSGEETGSGSLWGGSGTGAGVGLGGRIGVGRVFDAEDMRSDPPPAAPSMEIKEVVPGSTEEDLRPSERWIKNNGVTRVPLLALEEDIYRVPGQNFVCFSVVRPEDYKEVHHSGGRYHGSLIKFRGVFATREEADAHIRKLMSVDRNFDVHLVPAFTWAAMDDDDIENREYADDMVGEIMRSYFEEERKRREQMRQRIASTESAHLRGEYRDQESSAFFQATTGLAPMQLEDVSAERWPGEGPMDPRDGAQSRLGHLLRGETLASLAEQANDDVVISSELEEPMPRGRNSSSPSGSVVARQVVEEVLLDDEKGVEETMSQISSAGSGDELSRVATHGSELAMSVDDDVSSVSTQSTE